MGLQRLRAYRKEWDESRGVWKDRPRHDDASHGATPAYSKNLIRASRRVRSLSLVFLCWFHGKAHSPSDLKVMYSAIFDVPTDLGNLKPTQVPDRFTCPLNCILYTLFLDPTRSISLYV